MKAECYCQLEQDPDIAMKYLNMTQATVQALVTTRNSALGHD